MTCKDIFNGSTGNRATFLILEAGEPKTGVAYNAAGLVIAYRIDTGSQVAITLTSGNWFEIGSGKYVVDVPDSVYLAANLGKFIQFYGTLTDCAVYGEQHRVVANNPSASIAEAVAQYDQRDEEGSPGTIGWSFKKLRQANQAVEFVITNDIVPTTTTFSISLTAYDTSAFAHSVLLMLTGTAAEDNGVILSYTDNGTYATIVLEKPMTNAPSVGDEGLIRADSHVHSVAEIAAGVWGALTSGYSAATGTFGRVLYAISTMIENVSGWRWTATSLSQAPTESGIGQYQITLVADSTGGQVPGVVFRIVDTVLNVTTGSDGEAIINLDAGTYTLRTVAPAGYAAVADQSLTAAGDATVTTALTAVTITPPVNPGDCNLGVYVRNQANEPFPGVTVSARFPRGWAIAAGTMAINEVVTATTDANGLAVLALHREQDYDLSFARENGTIAKIRITTPNAATSTLSQSYQG